MLWVVAIVGTYMACRWTHLSEDVRMTQSMISPLVSYLVNETLNKCRGPKPRPKPIDAYVKSE